MNAEQPGAALRLRRSAESFLPEWPSAPAASNLPGALKRSSRSVSRAFARRLWKKPESGGGLGAWLARGARGTFASTHFCEYALLRQCSSALMQLQSVSASARKAASEAEVKRRHSHDCARWMHTTFAQDTRRNYGNGNRVDAYSSPESMRGLHDTDPASQFLRMDDE